MSYTFESPFQYIPKSEKFGSVGLGKLYIGVVNGNPASTPADRIQVYIARQGLSDLAISQPIDISAGGVPIYQGAPVTIKVNSAYSCAVLDHLGAQVYYSPISGDDITEFTSIDLRLDSLEAKSVQTVENFAALATTPATTAGMVVYVKQHTSGGIGSGHFQDFIGTVTNDGGTLINNTVTSGRHWKRIGFDYVTPEMYGAIPDGVINCSPALQSAWNSKYEIRLGAGVYNLFTPINMTNYAGGGKTVRGSGWGQSGNGSVLRANTGGVCLDLTGSQNITLSDFCIDGSYNAPPYTGDLSTPSNVGILYARSTTSPYCQFCTLENIYIYIPTSSSFGGKGGVGIYNNSAEIHHYNNIYVIADTPLATVTYNPWGVASPFQTIETGIISMSMITLTGTSTLHALKLTQQAWFANNAFGLCAENLYALGIGAAVLNMEGCNNINISGHIEGFDRVAILKNSKGARLKFTNPPQAQPPIYIGSTYAVLFDLDLQLDGVSNTWPQIIEGDVTSILTNIAINLNGDDGSRPLTNISAANVKCVTRRTVGTLGGLKSVSLVDAKVVLYMEFTPILDTQAINGSLFLDSATSKLSFKSGGSIFPLH